MVYANVKIVNTSRGHMITRAMLVLAYATGRTSLAWSYDPESYADVSICYW
jgi:lactate dehydrogenase-like 2-hydroxyacid dehydrogenase